MSEDPDNLKSGYCPCPAGSRGRRLHGSRIAIIATQWNIELVDALTDGAWGALYAEGIQ